MTPITLSDLVKAFSNFTYTGVQSNSKQIEEGNIFVAIDGTAVDGHRFIDDAIKRGAIAVVGEKPLSNLSVPYFQVTNSRQAIGLLAANFYGYPSKKHTVIGITGTNGKTTTSYLIKHIISFAGESCSLFGTVEHTVNDTKVPAINTTPDSTLLQKLLFESNDRYVVMEASSHGIVQHRLEGTSFDYGLFTNLSHDHLDYHGNLDNYFNAKAQLFKMLKKNGEAIIGSYSPWGIKLKERLKAEGITTSTFGEKEDDDLQLLSMESQEKPTFQIREGLRKHTLCSPLPGIHNVWNTMQAYLLARRIGIEPVVIAEALKTFTGVPGRFEQYKHPEKAKLIVDYAHSPDAIAHCLHTSRDMTSGRLLHIFGFRGKRDRLKRMTMVETSVELSDEVIITLDDLNGEDLQEMVFEINNLISKVGKNKCKVILDRTEAIKYAWDTADHVDTVLITGKGPEKYQQSFSIPSNTDQETISYLEKLL
ncbi:UDP-N-acetylmuramoyl-L-alanyl-D-glutamate--2,6-diaminopimelate ligase [Anaerobacillus sp. CMMVII]|uniref:UDP-N-acetylmuramoyl-L-alanyl-D-glutamate--2, 6-diaminopimelate ligase n=1 Tax=Anaerobacillus sp. CMMVII TaxID=2755588 RepID=UPI0021B81F6A|nr:UDP-N-acetylmuramoyl-L-alanyl-D-glutamate--2,6-diaminopimelate ligase [Anaerobacillus sp. CMMVII]MCT8137720.1 UDP-N-acetylmuramoyl-L-alanyl-D-glutamate--2,6-diaminopimelate ligase [Anaerobacillus sp. CMMVII]